MEAKVQHWFVYASLPGVVKMPDITPSALVSAHDTFEEADIAATERRTSPDGEALVYTVREFKVVATHSEAQLLDMASKEGRDMSDKELIDKLTAALSPFTFKAYPEMFRHGDKTVVSEVLVCDDDIVRARDVYSLAVEYGAKP